MKKFRMPLNYAGIINNFDLNLSDPNDTIQAD